MPLLYYLLFIFYIKNFIYLFYNNQNKIFIYNRKKEHIHKKNHKYKNSCNSNINQSGLKIVGHRPRCYVPGEHTVDAMFPGNIDGMFPGNINSEGNFNYYCMPRETISNNHVAVFYVEM